MKKLIVIKLLIMCHDFDTERLRRLRVASVLMLAVFTALHVRNLFSIINIFVQSLLINLCALHS